MAEYKDTLNLPQTDFPMKADLAKREPKILEHWNAIDLYSKIREKNARLYANGRPHMGTALNKTLKDIIVKSKVMSGFDAPFVPGWDCHGLPIELNVEKQAGKVGEKLDASAFRQACRDYAVSQIEIQRADFQRMGVLADWQKRYTTMDFTYEANEIRALAKIIGNGHLKRGEKPVHWCTACGSALAEAEVEYKDKVSPAIDVAFEVADKNKIIDLFHCPQVSERPIYVPIWTTTPWTLPANEAVCLNPKIEYVFVACEDSDKTFDLIVAKDLMTAVLERYGVKNYKVIGEIKGAELENILLQHPFLDKQVPIILGEHVTVEAGTGAVHTAPAHGQDDYVVGQKYHLPMYNPVDAKSCFMAGTPIVGGMHVFKANEPIIEALRQSHHLLHLADLNHSYPHCWRHKKPIIFRATPQWFISMEAEGLRKTALSAIEKVTWQPTWGETRLHKMIQSRPDWCISRQRVWGTPLTLIMERDSGELHPQMIPLMEKIADEVATKGTDYWYNLDLHDLIPDADRYVKVTDIVDVWLDSGLSHFAVLKERADLQYPADLYFEGSDQHRGWFQTSLLTACAMYGNAPYKQVVTHGYVVDSTGVNKMSKSLGNVIYPSEIIDKYGADILRLWASATDFTHDISVSDEILKRNADAYRRMRNTARFLLSNLFDFDAAQDLVAPEQMVALDRYVVEMTQRLQQDIIQAYDDFQFQKIYQLLHNYCTITLGGFYLDIIKDRLYTAYGKGHARRSAQTALYYILHAFVRWIAPILSFTAEEIWQQIPNQSEPSIFLQQWFANFPEFAQNAKLDDAAWEWLQSLRDEVNHKIEEQRNTGAIGSNLDAKVIITVDEAHYQILKTVGEELRFLLITSQVVIKQHAASSVEIVIEVITSDKCARCWQREPSVGQNHDHPELCARCVINLNAPGEVRQFA